MTRSVVVPPTRKPPPPHDPIADLAEAVAKKVAQAALDELIRERAALLGMTEDELRALLVAKK